MNRAHITLLALGVLIVVGCGSRGPIFGPSRSSQTTDPPTITISQAPEEEAELEDGAFILAGLIEAEAGLCENSPLVLAVTDLDTELRMEYELRDSLLAMATDAQPLNSYLNEETGAFVIDAENDFCLEAGHKLIELIVTDTEDRTATWSVTVNALQHRALVIDKAVAARAAFDGQYRAALQVYADLLDDLTFEAPIVYPTLDQEALDLVLSYLEARETTPYALRTVAYAFEDEMCDLMETAGRSLPSEEAVFRELSCQAAGRERSLDEQQEDYIAGAQFGYGRVVEISIDLTAQAYFEHTFVSATSKCYGEGSSCLSSADPTLVADYEVRIYQDIGAPLGYIMLPKDWDPQSLEPNTADPEEAILVLHIDFTDNDTDGAVDELKVSGWEYNAATDSHDDLVDFGNDSGHLLVPLAHFWTSQYRYRGGF